MSNLLCVGTAGMSVWFSRDYGAAFEDVSLPGTLNSTP